METDRENVISRSRYILPIAILFVAVLLIANTVASKIIEIGPFFVSGAIIVFPLSYIFGDILTEVYGYRASRRIIWSGFLAMLLMSLLYALVQMLPAAPFWPNQSAYDAILGSVPRIVFGSVVAYFVGEFANSYVLSKMKIWSEGKHLWMRTIGSTIIGEGLDTVLFICIAFWGVFPAAAIFTLIYSSYLIKVAYEIAVTPLTYMVVGWLKRAEGIDVYDRGVNYNPFLLKE